MALPEAVQAAVGRAQALAKAVRARFVDKDDVVDLMVLAMAAQEPLLLVGEPGTGKSDLVVQFCAAMGVRRQDPEAWEEDAAAPPPGKGAARPAETYFERLLTPYTEPDEIFGPVRIRTLLEEERLVRRGEGMLQRATVAFLDEIFKANSAILNSLLGILNERRYHPAGRPVAVPLVTLFAATNHLPDSPDLVALLDRFPLRVESRPVPPHALPRLLRLGMEREDDRLRDRDAGGGAPPTPLASVADFRLIHRVAVAAALKSSMDLAKSGPQSPFERDFVRRIRAIRDEDLCRLNDRRVVKLWKLMHARAVLDGRHSAADEDFVLLRHGWDDPSHERRARLERYAQPLIPAFAAAGP